MLGCRLQEPLKVAFDLVQPVKAAVDGNSTEYQMYLLVLVST